LTLIFLGCWAVASIEFEMILKASSKWGAVYSRRLVHLHREYLFIIYLNLLMYFKEA